MRNSLYFVLPGCAMFRKTGRHSRHPLFAVWRENVGGVKIKQLKTRCQTETVKISVNFV